MKRRTFQYILFIFFLSGIIFSYAAAVEENASSGVTIRPQVKYKSGQFRDPFQPYLMKKETVPGALEQGAGNLAAPKIDLASLAVQGIIWGGKIPQAIINNKVLAVGDSIEGGQIVSIDKGGISLNFSGEIINLPAPGLEAASKKDKE